MPNVKEGVADRAGGTSPAWYRWFARLERLLSGASAETGSGLSTNASGQLIIAANGVTDTMLRDSIGVSVIGRPLNSTGDPQDIEAGANGAFLQRFGDQVSFRYPRLPAFTIAGLPSATGVGDGTMAFATNGRKVGEGAGAGTGIPVYADGGNWYRFGDDTVAAA